MKIIVAIVEKWGDKYPMVIKSWNNNWENLSSDFKYSGEVRRLVYTTNQVEGLFGEKYGYDIYYLVP